MNNKEVANSLNFFVNSLAVSDQDALTTLVEDYFTVNNGENEYGNLIHLTTLFITVIKRDNEYYNYLISIKNR